jgi:hypothetical protein
MLDSVNKPNPILLSVRVVNERSGHRVEPIRLPLCRRNACLVPCKMIHGQRLPTTVLFQYARKDSNLQPSVPKVLKAFFCVSDAFQHLGFYWGGALATLSQCAAKAAKMRISGGTHRSGIVPRKRVAV